MAGCMIMKFSILMNYRKLTKKSYNAEMFGSANNHGLELTARLTVATRLEEKRLMQ
jgi:hypothetical protein